MASATVTPPSAPSLLKPAEAPGYTTLITGTAGMIGSHLFKALSGRGEGVIGKQPVLAPGERFEYTSGVPLTTASGFMTGRYQMVSESGEHFEIDVPTFSLDSPDSKRVLN